jgi:hypothetical protein
LHVVHVLLAGPATTAAAAAAAGARAGRQPYTPKTAEQLSPEELAKSLPSALFTTSNVILSSEYMQGVTAMHNASNVIGPAREAAAHGYRYVWKSFDQSREEVASQGLKLCPSCDSSTG